MKSISYTKNLLSWSPTAVDCALAGNGRGVCQGQYRQGIRTCKSIALEL